MLEEITPLILTLNEAPNIVRTLSRLAWARRIVVVDSGSTDGTRELLAKQGCVEVFVRPFDTQANQWNFGLAETGINTKWVLALDADYVLSEELLGEIKSISPANDTVAYRARFRYCIMGRPIRSGAYPPVVVLYRRDGASYVQDGHTQRVCVQGKVAELAGNINHDDRKPFVRWTESQRTYARLEADHLVRADRRALKLQDRIRLAIGVAPLLMFFYVYLFRGGFLDGRYGLYYALQRTYAELLLSLELLDRKLRGDTGG